MRTQKTEIDVACQIEQVVGFGRVFNANHVTAHITHNGRKTRRLLKRLRQAGLVERVGEHLCGNSVAVHDETTGAFLYRKPAKGWVWEWKFTEKFAHHPF